VDPTHFQAALEENLGKTVSSNGPPLTIKINGNGINRGLGGNQGAIGFASGLPTRMFQREDATSAIREYFKGSGIDLGTNSGRVVVCDLAGNTVTIRATKSELDVIAAAIQSLNQPPPEVNIKTKFVEFDDSGGNLLDNLAAGAPKITNAKVTPASVGLPGAPSQERSPAGATEGDATPSTITSILTDSQFRLLLRTFESRAGTKILTSPELTTENGRQGQMQAVDIQQIVTGFRGPGIVPTTTTMSFGPELDVVPYVDAARSNITLAIIPSIIDFVGYDNPGQFVPKIPGTNGGTITGVLPLPRFRLRQAVTSVTVRDGQTLVITGFASRDVVQTVKAKTPLLGSVPLLGRLFERQRTVTTKKGLAVFVTATIVNPDGTRYHRETADASPPPKDVK
jgi:type II secretory pathway component GspD/PulD (secretin)